ncbi:DUF974-domain-containing protein [Wolfiporia cocos MD-104 SS10]|uniref:DUF974-domain-containing protein n=1 Tax=Wolfiporia cocos (strain MD-104) TaxID=742152 RepID=A0A2H3J918_WOLCO|nr:DUF974-domain-containing protein [Wolfiporia cocos MD-104 SS10]
MSSNGHLLSLKVMRVSRPSLASGWEPFYSSSPSFSAHSTASIVSLQGKTALPGHPKTLRDLSHVTEMLMLPAAFGAIQLGEMFTSCLSVNNEASVEIEGVTLMVEIQTASTKTTLAEFGGPDERLAPGASLERVVSHEIKELGQHALACTVSYRLPPGARPAVASADSSDPNLQVFRKYYKFAVTNPLSVKTKVHVPRSPSALLSRTEREKVFLEIHIQNLTQDAMWLERMCLECADGWQSYDANLVNDDGSAGDTIIFSGPMALMQPQDMRQYVYILSPLRLAAFPVAHQPGSIVPLGRLDISWRSPYGEPGRLLTSMLSRRIPLIQAPQSQAASQAPGAATKQPASAIPLHLQRSASVASGSPSRPRSPQLVQRPMSPPASIGGPAPYRPSSPFRNRSAAQPAAITSPISPNPATRPKEDVAVDLVVHGIPSGDIRVEEPFSVACTLSVRAPVPMPRLNGAHGVRVLSFVVQHVEPAPSLPEKLAPTRAPPAPKEEAFSPRQSSSGFSTPSPHGTPQRADFQEFLAQKLLVASPRRANADEDAASVDGGDTPAAARSRTNGTVILPPPHPAADVKASARSHDVRYLGASTVFLPQLRLVAPAGHSASAVFEHAPTHERNVSTASVDSTDSELEDMSGASAVKVIASQDFELTYLPLKSGFITVGGLRVILVEDRSVEGDVQGEPEGVQYAEKPRELRYWEVVAEIWVHS